MADDFSITLNKKNASESTLVIASQELPPYYYEIASGEIEGMFANITRDVCNRENLSCTFFTIPFRRALQYIETGKIHMTMPMGKFLSREKVMSFSPTILDTGYVFFGKKENIEKLKSINQIEGIVGVHSKSTTEKELLKVIKDNNLNLTMKKETGVDVVLRKLEKDRYNYIFVNKDAIRNWQRQDAQRLSKYQAYTRFISPIKYHIAYTKNFTNTEVQVNLQKFQKALDNYLESSQFKKRLLQLSE